MRRGPYSNTRGTSTSAGKSPIGKMAQNTKCLYKILSLAWAYSFFQDLVGAKPSRARFVRQYVRPESGARVLDIGCGTAQILETLTDVQYVGYDLSPEYIE